MIEIADEAANTQFRTLLDRAAHGEVIVITREGKPLAQLGPVAPTHDVEAARATIRRLRSYAKAHPIPNISKDEIKSWIEEGRR